jgi:hypothetical protein
MCILRLGPSPPGGAILFSAIPGDDKVGNPLPAYHTAQQPHNAAVASIGNRHPGAAAENRLIWFACGRSGDAKMSPQEPDHRLDVLSRHDECD